MESSGGAVLPSFTLSGVLPPYHPEIGATANDVYGRSPYLITPDQLVAAFATTEERKSLLRNLFQYRQSLRDLGFHGYQWIDGSFVEDVEGQRGRPPGDIDLVTFLVRPPDHQDQAQWGEFLAEHWEALTPADLDLHCFFVDLSLPAPVIVRQSVYWFGLFSHQRETALWKGIVQIDLNVDDAAAVAMLDEADDAAAVAMPEGGDHAQ